MVKLAKKSENKLRQRPVTRDNGIHLLSRRFSKQIKFLGPIWIIVALWMLWLLRFLNLAGNLDGGKHLFESYSYIPPTTTRTSDKNNEPSTNTTDQRFVAVSPLKPLDYEQFTVRINSWKRAPGLAKVMLHLLTCDTVAQIQVVWAKAQGPVPKWLQNMSQQTTFSPRFVDSPIHRVVVEEHDDDTLNARFHFLSPPRTAGILSQDDDLYRPCEALDAGFAVWTLNPDRMVGFDARSHGINDTNRGGGGGGEWFYDSWNLPNKTNMYSFSLTKFAFVHKDYLDSYTTKMPANIRDHVANVRNCEDIAMSFWISKLTQGRPPLLADKWAMDAFVDVKVNKGLSGGGKAHTNVRHVCVDKFATIMKLKSGKKKLKLVEWLHDKQDKRRQYKKWLQSGVQGTGKVIPTRVVVKALVQRRKEYAALIKSDQDFVHKVLEPFIQQLTSDCRLVTQERFSIACHPWQYPPPAWWKRWLFKWGWYSFPDVFNHTNSSSK